MCEPSPERIGATDYVGQLMERLRERPLTLIPKDSIMTIDNMRGFSGGKQVLICDAPLNELTTLGAAVSGGYRLDEITNIDHHFEGDPRFNRQVSSTNLAIEYVKAHGVIDGDVTTIINHVDCDSILSSGILRGIIEPNEEFGIAAIAADHTGEPNEIADLLQSFFSVRDVEFSFRNLALLLSGKELEPKALDLLLKRLRERDDAIRCVEEDFRFTPDGKIAYFETDDDIDSALFPALLPDAHAVVVFCPRNIKDENGENFPGLQAKVRLGFSAPAGSDIRAIVQKFDKNFGGRWNAGANDRSGGMTMAVDEYIEKLSVAVASCHPAD